MGSDGDIEAHPRTFVFADMRGWTRYTQEHGDEAASVLAARFAELARETVPEFAGELLELTGDGMLSVFGSARQALRASVEFQRRLRAATGDEPAFPLGVGMGLDAGEAVPTEGGYRGGALNLAARLCARAAPGQILATDGVVHLARRVDGVEFGSPRSTHVKGLDSQVRFVEVTPTEPLPPLPPTPPVRRGVPRWAYAVAGVVVVAAATAVVLVILTGSHPTSGRGGVVVHPVSIAAIDPRSGRVVADYPVALGPTPAPLVAGEGHVWTYNADQQLVIGVDTESGKIFTQGVSATPTDITFGGGYIWLADGIDNTVVRVDPISGGAGTTIHLPPPPRRKAGVPSGPYSTAGQIAFADSSVWSTVQGFDWPSRLVRINAGTLRVTARVDVGQLRQIGDLATGPAGVWMENRIAGAASGKAALAKVAAPPGKPQYVGQGNYLPQGVAVGDNSVWFVGGTTSTAWLFEPSDRIDETAHAPGILTAVTTGSEGTWVASAASGGIFRIDATTGGATKRIQLRCCPNAIAFAHGLLWVSIQPTPIQY